MLLKFLFREIHDPLSDQVPAITKLFTKSIKTDHMNTPGLDEFGLGQNSGQLCLDAGKIGGTVVHFTPSGTHPGRDTISRIVRFLLLSPMRAVMPDTSTAS